MKRVLISLRLIFIAALILVFVTATAVKKPRAGNIAEVSGLGAISFLADFTSETPKNEVPEEAIADNPDVPITSSPDTPDENTSEAEEKEEEETDNNSAASVSSNPTSKNIVKSSATSQEKTSVSAGSTRYISSDTVYVDDNGEVIDNPIVYPIPYQDDTPQIDDGDNASADEESPVESGYTEKEDASTGQE